MGNNIIWFGIFCVAIQLVAGNYVAYQEIQGAGSNKLCVNFANNLVNVKVEGPDDRWFGVGFSTNLLMSNTPSLIYSDIAGTMQARDHYNPANRGTPTVDTSAVGLTCTMDWTQTHDSMIGGRRTICATRPFAPPDACDFAFVENALNGDFLWAHGANPGFNLQYHGSGAANKGAANLAYTVGTGSCVCETVPVGGDPEFMSLDGLSFNYDGPCSYVLLTNQCDTNKKMKKTSFGYEVLSHHSPAGNMEDKIVVIKQISINIWKISKKIFNRNFKLKSQNRVFLDDKKISLPYNDTMISIQIEDNRSRGKSFRRIHFRTVFGLDFYWTNHKGASMDVFAPEGEVCGLLGNHNNNKKDDIKTRNGTIFGSSFQDQINRMGDSWMVEMDNQPLRCSLHSKNSASSLHQCQFDIKSVQQSCKFMLTKTFKKLRGKNVKKCFGESKEHNAVDATRIYQDCVTEICACNKKQRKDCVPKVAMKEFKDVCVSHGVALSRVEWSS